MALSESEELELLQLQKSKALGQNNPSQMGGKPPLGFVAKQVLGMTPMAHPIDNLPLIGTMAGTAMGGPMGAAAGAGTGQIFKRIYDLASGASPLPATKPLIGGIQMPMASEAVAPMTQAALAGIAQEPKVLNEIPGVPQVVDYAKRAGTQVGKGLARLGEAASGVKAQDIKQLFKNPGQLWHTGSREAAGQAIGDAKLAAGVNPGITEDIKSFTPSNVFKATKSDAVGEKALNQVAEAVSSGGKPSVEDVGDALKHVSKQIKAGLNQGLDTSELQNIQAHLNTVLEDIAPNVQAARQEFAPLAQRDKFLKLFPTNKNGTISKANLLYLNTIAKGATIPFRAPITTGLVTSAAGGATKAINSIAENPQARQVLMQVLQRLTQGKNPQE